MENPKQKNEISLESYSEPGLELEGGPVDSSQLKLPSSKYTIDYNHPMGTTVATILVGMFASVLDGGGGALIILLGGSLILSLSFLREFVLFVLVFVGVLGYCYLFVSLMYKETDIVIDGAGIKFPFVLAATLKLETERSWDEVRGVKFANLIGNSLEDDRILIAFYDGSILKLNIDGFSRASLKKFILLINTFRPDITIKSDFSDLLISSEGQHELREELLSSLSNSSKNDGRERKPKSAISFTQIWESELNSRYGTTAYTPLECGDVLQEGSYKVMGQIAFGGLSAIYLVEDAEENLLVLKESVLPESCDEATKEKALKMFQREAQLLCGISHRNISKVYDYFVNNDRHYMVLQHLDGRTVRNFVNEFGPQSEEVAIRWGIELASTLSYLHNLEPPIIHRDITPDNIIVRKDGSISIIDFGAANNFIGTATCTVVGKSSYIPLEQFQGKAKLCSDIYSFGATLYFILTDRDPAPFTESDLQEDGALISNKLNELVKDCTKVKFDSRIATVEELMERLAPLADTKGY